MNIEKLNKEQLVPYYLMASYLYYITHKLSPMSDEEFDSLCRRLIDEYDGIEHPHKSLVSLESLRAGTGFNLSEKDYPLMVIGGAHDWYDTYHSVDKYSNVNVKKSSKNRK